MSDLTNIMFCGFGGQGIVLAGVIIGQAAVYDGLNVAQASSYGSEARGSACRSEIILACQPIVYPHIDYADILGVMSQPGYDKFRARLRNEKSLLVFDENQVEILKDIPQFQQGFPATEIAIKQFNKKIVANIIFLSAIIGWRKLVSPASLEKSVRKNIPSQFVNLNLEAMSAGLELGRKISLIPNS